jgi:hypothetical protein
MSATNKIPQDLILIKERIYDPYHFNFTAFEKEKESAQYDACDYQINEVNIKYRKAKITPTKIGQFVTLWKRNSNGIIQPFKDTDPIDFVIVGTKNGEHLGHFVFPKSVLCEQGVFSTSKKEGKRAIRVYPPWDKTISMQAKKAQNWQLAFFIDLTHVQQLDITRLKELYHL